MQTGLDLMKELSITSPAKIVLLVIDGLGGLPHDKSGKTELETANTPNMNKLASYGQLRTYPDRGDRYNAGQRARPPGAIRLRPPGLYHRTRRA